jgi:hypothetical protein
MFGRTAVGSFSIALIWGAMPARPGIPGTASSTSMARRAAVSAVLLRADTVSRARSDSAASRADSVTVLDSTSDDSPDDLREFHRHAQANRLGYFIDAKQMAVLHPAYASDALRRIPGVVVRPSTGIGNQVRIRGCAPLVWVDGARTPGAELDEVTHGNDVAAVEIYRSLAGVPAEYSDRRATCGTIVVWLKSS